MCFDSVLEEVKFSKKEDRSIGVMENIKHSSIVFRRLVLTKSSRLDSGEYFFEIRNGSSVKISETFSKEDLTRIHNQNLNIALDIEHENLTPRSRTISFQLKKKVFEGSESIVVGGGNAEILDRYCLGFPHSTTIVFPNLFDLFVDIILEDFGCPYRDRIYPFHQLFHREYQYAPVIGIIFSYLPSGFLIRNVSVLSKHINEVLSNIRFVDPVKMKSKNLVQATEICQRFRISKIEIDKFCIENEEYMFRKIFPEPNVTLQSIVIRSMSHDITYRQLYSIINHFKCLRWFEINTNVVQVIGDKIKPLPNPLLSTGFPRSIHENDDIVLLNELDMNTFCLLERHDHLEVFKLFGEVILSPVKHDIFFNIADNCPKINQIGFYFCDRHEPVKKKYPFPTLQTRELLCKRNMKIIEPTPPPLPSKKKKNRKRLSDEDEDEDDEEEEEEELEPLMDENDDNNKKNRRSGDIVDELFQQHDVPLEKDMKKIPFDIFSRTSCRYKFVPEWTNEMSFHLKMEKPLNHEAFMDRFGFIWKITNFHRVGHPKVDVLYIESLNELGTLFASVKVKCASYLDPAVPEIHLRSKKTTFTRWRGCTFYHFHEWNPDDGLLPPRIQIKVHERIPDIFKNGVWTIVREKAQRSYKIQSHDFDIPLKKFDQLYDGDIMYRKRFRTCNQDWELSLKRSRKIGGFYSMYFYCSNNDAYVVICTIKVNINGMSRSIVNQTFNRGAGFGWDSLDIDSTLGNKKKEFVRDFKDDEGDENVIHLFVTFEMQRIFSSREYEEYRLEKQTQARLMMDRFTCDPGVWETKDLKIAFGSLYITHTEETWESLGLKWKILMQKERGKYKRGALFIYCDFTGEYVVRARYKVEILGSTDFVLESTTVDYYEGLQGRSGGNESSQQQIYDGIYTVRVSVNVVSCLTRSQSVKKMSEVVKKVEKVVGNQGEVEIIIRTKNRMNTSYQSEIFLINNIPHFVEFYPNGLEEMDEICFCIYHQLTGCRLTQMFEVSMLQEKENKVYTDKRVSQNSMAKFNKFCKVNNDQDWVMKIKMTVLSLKMLYN